MRDDRERCTLAAVSARGRWPAGGARARGRRTRRRWEGSPEYGGEGRRKARPVFAVAGGRRARGRSCDSGGHAAGRARAPPPIDAATGADVTRRHRSFSFRKSFYSTVSPGGGAWGRIVERERSAYWCGGPGRGHLGAAAARRLRVMWRLRSRRRIGSGVLW